MKIKFVIFYLAGIVSLPVVMQAQLAVNVSSPKVIAQKAVVELKMTNSFPQKIESARAVCFLLDDQGKMVGQSTKWVIGGKDLEGLSPNADTTYDFVITGQHPFSTTNLTAKVLFTKAVLSDNKQIDVAKEITITPAPHR